MVTVKNKLNEILEGIDVDKIGVVKLDDWKDTPIYESAKRLLPEAKSIIVLALQVFPEVVKYLTSQRKVGEMVLSDLFSRNTEVANGHLDWEAYKIMRNLHKLGYKGIPLPASGAPYDSRLLESMLSYRRAAQLAGLGVRGWNSMHLTPEDGARVRLTCIVTRASLPS